MSVKCPNKAHPDWVKLVNKIGVRQAYAEYMANNDEIPNPDNYEDTFKGVNATLKIVSVLDSERVNQLFNRFYTKNNKEKFYNELIQLAGKKQVELLKEYNEVNNPKSVKEMISGILSEIGYTVEINTAKYNTKGYDVEGVGEMVDMQEGNSQHYSNLTVPGGTNYTENEISTPLITPSIKGHAQFATDNGIGWFRSDDKINNKQSKQDGGNITFEDFTPALLNEYKNELQEYQISLAESEIELPEIKKREEEFKNYFLNKINNKVNFPTFDINKYEPYKKAKYIIESSENTKNKYKQDLESINNELNKINILNSDGDLIYDENKKITIKLIGFGLPSYETKAHKEWLEEIEKINEEIKYLSLKIINAQERLQNAEIDFYTKESENRKDFIDLNTKTRRILEVQSDLFQKGRNKENLILKEESKYNAISENGEDIQPLLNNDELEEFDANEFTYKLPSDEIIGTRDFGYGEVREDEDNFYFESGDGKYSKISKEKYEQEKIRLSILDNAQLQDIRNKAKNLKENQFLLLLNKDNNWVTFFVKSIIQDSAKKGYEKVLFPTGNTASKVEGHTTLEEFKKQKEDRIKELEENTLKEDSKNNTILDDEGFPVPIYTQDFLNDKKNREREITQLKQELERVETEGFGALKPIFKFYEETVSNILKKQGYNPQLITDEYGNTWNEVEITPEHSTKTITLDRLQSVLRSQPQELPKEEIEWFKSQFPGIPVETVKGLIDNKSLGRFISSGKVLLSDLAPKNTLRHEAFHVVTQLFLTKEEIADLYKEVRNKFKNKDLTDLEVEEILAEDFANYKDTGSILGGRTETKNIFQKLLDFIKSLIGLSNTQVRDIYNRLETGDFLGKQIVGNNQFRSLDKSLPGKTVEFSKDVLDGVDYEFFQVLFENGFTPEKLFQVSSLSSKIYDIIRDAFIEKYEEAQNANNTQGIENFEYILENWNEVLDLHNARIKSLGVSLVKGENEKTGEVTPNVELTEEPNLVTEESINKDENSDNRSGEAYQNANTISTKDLMFKQTKLLIATLPKLDKSGEVKLNNAGLATLVDLNSTYNFLLKNLAGLSDFSSMVDKIKELSKNRPEFKILLDRLGVNSDLLSYDQIMFQNQFRQDFDKNFAVSNKTILKADGTIYVIDATRENTAGKVKDIWRNKLPLLVEVNKDGKLVTNEEYLKSKDNIEFLSKIGINFSEETLPALENNDTFNKAVLGIKQYIYRNKYDLTDLFNENSDAKGNLNTLYDLEAKYTPDVTELSFVSTEGKTVYSISLNNALSIVKNIINNSKTKAELFAKLPHLNTVYNQNSIWLKTMFNESGEKKPGVNIDLDLADGLKTQDVEDSAQKQTTKLSKGDKLVQELNNLLLEGKTAYIRASDKSTEHTLSLNNYGRGEKLPIPIKSLEDGFDSVKLKDIFRGYFKDELQRIYKLEVEGLGEDFDQYREAGKKWGIFSDFPNSSDIKKAVKVKIEELKTSDLSNSEKQEQIDELYNSLLPEVDKITIDFFNKYTKELITDFEKVGITKENRLGISKELFDKGYTFEQIMRALAVNDFINSVEQVKLFVGDLAFYKDLFKRTSAFTGTKKTARVDNTINSWLNTNVKRLDEKEANGKINVLVFEDVDQKSNYKKEYINSLVDSGITPEQADIILEAYNNMTEGDAQGYITLDEYKEFFVRTGDWSIEHERIFNKSQNGETLNADEIGYFMPIKAQYAGPQESKGLYAPAYHKYSLMPLIPQMVKGKNLEKLLDNMIKNQVGYSVFKSGSKVGTKVDSKGKANKFYTDINNGEINNENLLKQVIDYKFLGIQLDISPKLKEKVIFGTQFRKLLFSNLFEGGNQKMDNAKDLFDEYTKIFGELIEAEKSKLIKELGVNEKSYKQEDVKKLVDLLREESKDRNLADNIIDALQVKEVEGKIMLKYNFDSMVNKNKIDSMIMSIVNSRLIKQMMNGDAMIQGASTGFEKTGRRIEGSNDLKFYRKDDNKKTLAMEVKVPLTGQYKSLLEKYKTLDEVNKALKDGEISKDLLTLVGYRIPTQGLNSIEFMEIQEFLPESAGNLIILPTEIVAKSGGDYDIDKMNIFRPYFNPKNKTQRLQNRIISIAKEILEQEFNFNSLITPNSTKILTDIVDELRFIEFKDEHPDTKLTIEEYTKKYKSDLKNIRYTNQLKLTTKVDQFEKFLGGKAGVGIGALQNTHHILSQIANINLNRFYIDEKGDRQYVTIYFPHNKTENEDIDLSKIKDIKGNNNISEVISQIINASVDIAKDPFMFDLNMNLSTLSTYLYLVRTGVEFEQVAYFMKQPIITEFLNESTKNKSIFLKASGKSKSDSKIVEDLISNYEEQLKEKLKIKSEDEFDVYMEDIKPRYNITTSELKSYLSKKNQNSVAYLHTQIQLLRNYTEYKKQAGLLSEAINSVNHDTAGLGSSINASRNKIEQKELVKKTGFVNNIDNIYNNTFVGKFDQHQLSIDLYSQFYHTQANEDIVVNNRNLLDRLTDNFTKKTDKNKLITLIENDFINYVVQNYGYEANISSLIDNLFKGDNSIAKQILEIKTAKKEDLTPERQKLKDNLLIKELFPLLKDKSHLTTDNIKIFAKRFDTFTSNQLTESFREIQDLDANLAKDLMDLGILQSGLNNSAITFMGIIPFEYYGDLVNQAFDNFNKKNGAEDLYKFNQLFVRNNDKNPVVAKKAKGLRLGTGELYGKAKKFAVESGLPFRWDNSLGNGMYGKLYDLNLHDSKLTDIKLKDKVKKDIFDESTEIEDYTADINDNSENNQKDYGKDLDNSENISTFDESKPIEDKKVKAPVRADSLTEFKKAVGLRKSQVDFSNRYDIKRKEKLFNDEFGSNYRVSFKKVGESNLFSYDITGGPKEIEVESSQIEIDFNTPINEELNMDKFEELKQDILRMEEGELKDYYLSELGTVSSNKELGSLYKKICNL